MGKPALFQWIDSINYSKKDIMEIDLSESEYNPYMINLALSMDESTILFANMMNINYQTTKNQQYKFLLYSIPKGKRYLTWAKGVKKSEDIEYIKNHYECSTKTAEHYSKLLTDEQIKSFIPNKGGRKNEK